MRTLPVNQSQWDRIVSLRQLRTDAENAAALGSQWLQIKVIKPHAPTSSRIHLAGHRGPVGSVDRIEPRGSRWLVTARFDAPDVMAWCEQSISWILSEINRYTFS